MIELLLLLIVAVASAAAIWFGLSGARTELLIIGICAVVILVMGIVKSIRKKGKQ